MGVPAFFRWLSEKYPKIIQDIVEERVHLDGGQGSVRIPFDATKPNPSGLECDHLYIDMNGIIHPCSHPEQGPQPQTEEEMYENVCHYVDRLFRIMRPRKLLYLAIDGVAPRAKMNQQRARRFRSAQEARENLEVEQQVRVELTKMGQKVPPAKKAWDSNVITPGTPFMLRLSEYLRFYIRKRLSTDPAWKKVRVIFSDASVPGEGEHKIMAHVRLQRSQPGYTPNLVHVLHGLDADLIMLALATHEAHFYISREEVLFGRKSQEQNDHRQMESGYKDQQRALDEGAGTMAMALPENCQKPLVRISIPILREYLAAEFSSCIQRVPFPPSLERLIDDIVFLCFFVGNDFLPHLPSLDIRDGALDYLFNVYKRILPGLGDYITNHGGQVNLSHVDVILAEVGSIEDYVFAMKHDNEQQQQDRRKQFQQRKKQAKGRSLDAPPIVSQQPKPKKLGRAARLLAKEEGIRPLKAESLSSSSSPIKSTHMKTNDQNLEAALSLKKALLGGGGGADTVLPVKAESAVKEEPVVKEEQPPDSVASDQPSSGTKRKLDDVVKEEETEPKKGEPKKDADGAGLVGDAEEEFEDDGNDDDEDVVPVEDVSPVVAAAFKDKVKDSQKKKLDKYAENVEDKVRLHESGWKDRYYSDKCKADDVAANGGREHMFRSYVVGLCWVMKYYYDGCCSWKWYYPFHYAPFASDLRNIERFQPDVKSLELARPFNPIEQLMAVLPSDSDIAIPKAARWLMSDEESPILDFYPSDVPVDPNGKAMPWLWVVLLPFIEEERLLGALSPTMAKWSNQELLCNARGLDDGYLLTHSEYPLSTKLKTVLAPGKTAKAAKTRLLDAASYGCAGFTGSLRPPLSNEIYDTDADVRIEAPTCSEKTEFTSVDNLFSEPLYLNDAICVAFTEPSKLPHKSILIPGAISPPPTLNEDDKRIRRPRLNRGGGNIANMGLSNGQSHKGGYGSMNIGSYERNLAHSTGRGNQMNQTGTRAWGAMEPTPKRPFQGQNPFMNHQGGRGNVPPPPPPPPPPPGGWQQQRQSHNPHHHHQGQGNMRGGGPPYNNGFGRHRQPPHGQRQPGHPPGQQYQQHGHQQQQQYQQQQRNNYHQQHNGPPPSQQRGGPNGAGGPPRHRQGFNFQNHAQQQQGGRRPPPPPPPNNNRVNANVMSDLKAQLASTLKQSNRRK